MTFLTFFDVIVNLFGGESLGLIERSRKEIHGEIQGTKKGPLRYRMERVGMWDYR